MTYDIRFIIDAVNQCRRVAINLNNQLYVIYVYAYIYM